jgi:thiol-disulfide isomerase/thioredoxin
MIALACGLAVLGIIEIFHLAVTTALVRRLRAGQAGLAVEPDVGGPKAGEQAPRPSSLPGVPEDTDILLGFFSSGCPACQVQAPRFAAMVPKLAEVGARAVAVLNGIAGPNRDALAAALAPAGEPLLDDQAREVFRSFGITATPAFFLLRPDGTVTRKGVTVAQALTVDPREHASAGA